MRVLFHLPAQGIFRHTAEISHANGTLPLIASSISDLKKSFVITGNTGNIIHAEAPQRVIDRDVHQSVQANLLHLKSHYGDEFRKVIRKNFDLVVISVANFIRSDLSPDALANAVDELETPFVVLGAGIQDELPTDLSAVTPATQKLLRTFNDRALLFGARGEQTGAWLHAVGLTNARVLGCPSFFSFPRNLLAVRFSDHARRLDQDTRIGSASHLGVGALRGSKRFRIEQLIRGLEGYRPDYVFQDEIFSYSRISNDDGFYDEASGECDGEAVRNVLRRNAKLDVPFARFWYFQNCGQWRQFYVARDLYVGDRLHGGVAALQAGTPALIIHADARMSELVDYFAVPSVASSDFAEVGLAEVLADTFSPNAEGRFREVYRERLRHFVSTLEEVGLTCIRSLRQPEKADVA